jgi:hypothetical protein
LVHPSIYFQCNTIFPHLKSWYFLHLYIRTKLVGRYLLPSGNHWQHDTRSGEVDDGAVSGAHGWGFGGDDWEGGAFFDIYNGISIRLNPTIADG